MKKSTQRRRVYQALQSEVRRIDTAERKVQEQQALHAKTDPKDYKVVAHEYEERLRVLLAARARVRSRLRGLVLAPLKGAELPGGELPGEEAASVTSDLEAAGSEAPSDVDRYLEGSELSL